MDSILVPFPQFATIRRDWGRARVSLCKKSMFSSSQLQIWGRDKASCNCELFPGVLTSIILTFFKLVIFKVHIKKMVRMFTLAFLLLLGDTRSKTRELGPRQVDGGGSSLFMQGEQVPVYVRAFDTFCTNPRSSRQRFSLSCIYTSSK